MKKWLSLLISLFIVFSGISYAYTQEEDRFRIFIDRLILGEVSSFRFLVEELPFELEVETIDLKFPQHYQLPLSIHREHIVINEDTQPVVIETLDHQTLRMQADLSGMDRMDIRISHQARVVNPIEWPYPSTFAIVFSRTDYVLVSQQVQLRLPINTVNLSGPANLPRSEEWINEAFNLKMHSSTAKRIYYAINQDREQLYDQPLMIRDGIHEIMYYGVRDSGAREIPEKIKFKVDTHPPRLQLLSPRAQHLTNQEEIVLEFNIQSLSPAKLIIEKKGEFLVPENGRLNIAASLTPGINHFTYKAINAALHEASGSIEIMLDITPPYLEIMSPRNNELICSSSINIIGKAEIGSKVSAGDLKIPLDRFGNFIFQWIPDKGKNHITIRAFDPAGNETRRDLHFLYFPGIVIENYIGQSSSKINGEEKLMNPSSFQDKQTNELYFPLRFMAEALSYQLQWVPEGSYVSMKRKEREIRVRSFDSLVQVRQDDQIMDIRLQHVPTIYQGSMMIPSEFIKRVLMGDVLVDTVSRRVIIHFCEEL